MTYEKLVFNFFIIFSCGTPTKGSFKEPPFVDSHITCGRDFIQLDVKLNPQIWERVQSKLEMHLIDKYCKPFYVNSTHASIRTPLYDCGTNLEVTKDHMIFSNSFMMSEEPEVGQLVSFIPDVEVKFRCTYSRKNNTRRIAPLQLDTLHSSPSKVSTLRGLPVVLKCVFKYGSPPVRVVILRDGKIVANQENGTKTAKITVGRRKREFGLYTCRAEDTKKVKITHDMELTKLEPLTADKSKSSPFIVKTYKGFTVRLMCTFKGGVAPLRIKLTRGKKLASSVEVKERTLYFTVKTGLTARFRSYECIATDAEGIRVKQRITLRKAGPRDLTSDGVKVNCKSDFMDVSLSRLVYPWLDPGLLRISLIQSTCTAYTITDLEVRIQAPLSRCGSKTNLKNKYTLRSRNTVITQPRRPEGVLITYLPEIHFPFTCDYEITHAQGKTSLKPIGPLMPDVSNSSNTVVSPPKMTTKLRCVFQGGEPPIRVSMSRHKVKIAHAQGRTLSFVIKPHIYDDGHFVCRATDARNKTVTHKINLHVPVHGIVWNKGAEIDCGSKITTVTLFRANFPWLDIRRMHVHLIDPTCRGYLNSTHVSFRFQTGGCGSKHIKSSSRDVIFSNKVFIVNKPHFQERKHKSILEINFYCKYSHTGGGNKKIKGFL
ncbi:uncharacterized protein [Porites lutea]|uniref:uncharacterized protein isoform X2 n=1 Tax=Porites lutea TaxID=51062 RepID=UPI003CC687E1